MSDGALAELIVALHFGFVLFVLFGGLLVWWRRWVMWIHLPAAAWGAFVELTGTICPLTPLENSLRRSAGLASYHGGFIEHYILPVLYPRGLTRPVQLVLAIIVVGLNLLIYWKASVQAPGRGVRPTPAAGRRRDGARSDSGTP